MEKGRNHLLDPDDLTKPAADYSNDEIKFMSRYFLGPDPLIEPRAFRRSAEEGEHTHVGEVNSIPTTVGGGGIHADGKVPRFREEDFRLPLDVRPAGGRRTWTIGRLTYDELEPFYAEVERAIGVAGRAGANPFAAWRSGPYPMPPGAPMYGAVLSSAAAERRGPAPLRGPDRGQQRSVRRASGLQQLRLLRLLRLPDPRQGRPGCAPDQDHGHRAGRVDGRNVRVADSSLRAVGPPGSTTSVPTGSRRVAWTPRSSSWPAAPSRRPGCF